MYLLGVLTSCGLGAEQRVSAGMVSKGRIPRTDAGYGFGLGKGLVQ